MTSNARREEALKLLATTGLNRLNYAPPLVRMLWRMGFDVPPPHFASFFYSAAMSGIYFAVGLGLLMWLMLWSSHGVSIPLLICMAAFAGLFFGVAMAGYYAIGRRKYHLPKWETLLPTR
jgi:hypothetical protein